MLTLGTWLGPIIASIIAVIGIPAGLRIRFRRGRAIERLAAAVAQQYSERYPEQYQGWHDYFTGRRKDAEGITKLPPQ